MPNLSYNGRAFAPDSVWFTITKRAIIGGTGRRNFVHEQWNINGRVSGANTAAVQGEMASLESSLNDGGDLVFSLYHSLLSADCVEGTHVREFAWLPGYDAVRGSGAELVLRRTFRLVIDGKKIAPSDLDLIAYHEAFRGVGTGGPIILPVHAMTGEVQAQQTVRATEFWSTQSGYAVGLLSNPPAATALWQATDGVYYKPLAVSGTLDTPMHYGRNVNTAFRTSWSYTCWSRVPLIGSPSPLF